MDIVKFKGYNIVYGANQEEYLNLPVRQYEDGLAISCFKPSLKERLKILFIGKIWISILTFNKPLQPIKVEVDQPFKEGDIDE